jgi:hypothetical protein
MLQASKVGGAAVYSFKYGFQPLIWWDMAFYVQHTSLRACTAWRVGRVLLLLQLVC